MVFSVALYPFSLLLFTILNYLAPRAKRDQNTLGKSNRVGSAQNVLQNHPAIHNAASSLQSLGTGVF